MKNDLLRTPGGNLGRIDLVRVPAVELVDRAELLRRVAGLAELPEDRAVELHLVDLAGGVPRRRRAAVGPRIGDEQVLMRPARDADRPRVADVVVDGLQVEVVVEDLNARVAAISDVHIALSVDRDRV